MRLGAQCEPHKLGDVAYAELFHDPLLVYFHGSSAYA
jgi:hypothetical protein